MCQAVPGTHPRCQTEQVKHPVRGTEEPAGPGGSGREGRCPGPKQVPRASAGRPRPSSHRRDCEDGANNSNGPEPAHSKAPRWAEGPGWRSRFPALLPLAPRSRGDTDAPRTPSPTPTLPAPLSVRGTPVPPQAAEAGAGAATSLTQLHLLPASTEPPYYTRGWGES